MYSDAHYEYLTHTHTHFQSSSETALMVELKKAKESRGSERKFCVLNHRLFELFEKVGILARERREVLCANENDSHFMICT